MSDLMRALRVRNFDDRCEPNGAKVRNVAATALENLATRTSDMRILAWALNALPRKETF